MPQEWYVRIGSEETGPLTLQELFVRCRTGQLEPKSPVRSSDGNGKWRHAENVDEILFGNPEELREARRNVLRSPNPDLDECYWNEVFERVEESRSYFEGYSSSTNGGSSAKSDDSNSAAVHYGRGWAWLLKDDFDVAIREFTDAVRLDPKSAASFHARGTSWLKKDEFAFAMRDFDAAIRLDPKYALPTAYDIESILDAIMKHHEDNPNSSPSLRNLWPDCPPKLLKVLQERLNPVLEAEQIFASPENKADERIDGPKPLQPHEGYRPVPSSSYVLTKELGSGHFGAVWRAEHPTFGPSVFKFCTKPDQRWIKSLQNEMQKTYQLSHPKSHPGIVTLLGEHLSDSRIPCLQYEFVDGRDLRKVLGGESEKEKQFAPFKPDHAAAVILKLVEIMAYVHDRPQPVVHRDLKPANILVTNHRDLDVLTAIGVERDLRLAKFKVMDFGLAGHARPQRQPDSEYSIGAQFDGTGTTAYMSPQQKRGEPSHPSDDIFAIGVMWYEFLAGKVGFGPPGKRAIERLENDFQLRGGTSEQWKVLADCLDEDREHRIKNAMELKRRIRATYTLETPVDLYEQVKQAVKRGTSVEKVTSLSVEMAELLAKELLAAHEYIALPGLVSLSTDVAQALASVKCADNDRWEGIYLDGLNDLTLDAAKAISSGDWYRLTFNGLDDLLPEVAGVLTKTEAEEMEFDGLESLRPETAKCFGQWEGGELSLEGLKSLPTDAALSLGKRLGGLKWYLDGLENLTKEMAGCLAMYEDSPLNLNSVKDISLEAAIALAVYDGTITLNGLKKILPSVALALAEGVAEHLSLDGLSELTMDVATALARYEEGGLSLNGLTSLNPKAALALAQKLHGNDLHLEMNGLEELKPDVARAIGHCVGLSLNGLKELPADAAKALAEGSGSHAGNGSLELNGLNHLTPEAAQAIAKWNGSLLSLKGLVGVDSDDWLGELSDTYIEPDVFGSLAKWNGSFLHLDGLLCLDLKQAQALARWKGDFLYLNGISVITEEATEALARWKGGTLSIGLKELSPTVAQALAKSKADGITLNDLSTISPEAALALAKWRGGNIVLWGLKSLSSAAAQSLKKLEENSCKVWYDRKIVTG